MTVDLMRCIDYWVGIPTCFLLTVVNYILNLFTFKNKKKKNNIPKKILFIKLSEMGSIILAHPLISKVKDDCQDAEIFFLTFETNKSIFRIFNIISYQNIFTIREKSFHFFILDTLRVIRKIRRKRINIVFDLELFSRFTAILCYLTGASKRVGFYRYSFEGLYRGNLLTHNILYNPLTHISKSFLSLWQTAIRRPKKTTPELEKKIEDNEIVLPRYASSPEEIEKIRDRLKMHGVDERSRLFLVNLGDGRLPLREWSLENFITLSKMLLLEERRNYIIIVGTPRVSKRAEMFCKSLGNEKCIDLNNKTTLLELLTLFNIAEALITTDCGLAHLASLASIKKFVIFGPESPVLYSPLGEDVYTVYSNLPCSPCLSAFNHRKSSCIDNVCLKSIKPDEVFSLLNKY